MTIDELISAMNQALAKKDFAAFERYDNEHRILCSQRNKNTVDEATARYLPEDFAYMEGQSRRQLYDARRLAHVKLRKAYLKRHALAEASKSNKQSILLNENKLRALQRYIALEEERSAKDSSKA